ncbi:MAG: hypothetical protein V4575_08400 [Pseudomonadota bacterium]
MDKMRRNLMIASFATAAVGVFGMGAARQTSVNKSKPAANARLGINLTGIAYWTSEFPFVDMFKQSSDWSIKGKEPAESGLLLDADGWITQLPPNAVASTIISVFDGKHFPSGDYVILYEGEGVIKVPNHLHKSAKPGRMVVNVNAEKGSFVLEVSKINPQNYIRNIRVVPVSQEQTYLQKRWNPAFLARWSGVACLRFMDYMQTNNSQQSVWAERVKPSYARFGKNIPLEWLVDLANQLHCDAWFCMPHKADDDYIKQFAHYVKIHLKPELHAWVEHSNEVWNGGFQQHHDAAKAGLQLRFSDQPWEAALKYHAYRSVQIFKIWSDVFQDSERLVRVLASQAATAYASEQIVNFQNAASHADVLAIAPYISFMVGPTDNNGLNDKTVSQWSLDRLFDHLNRVCLPESIQWIKNHKKIADEYGLKLVAYEAGQHAVGVGGGENNEQLNDLFYRANTDARMGDIYSKSLTAWTQSGGDLICHFNSVGSWSKWGSWGLLQRYDDVVANSPKFTATIQWAISRGQKMVIK